MLPVIDFDHEDKVLDLDCGYGIRLVLCILAAKLTGTEISLYVTEEKIEERASKKLQRKQIRSPMHSLGCPTKILYRKFQKRLGKLYNNVL